MKLLRKNQRVILLITVLVILLTGTACEILIPPKIPELVGLSPYEAVSQLERVNKNIKIEFISVNGDSIILTDNDERYMSWEVISTEPSAGASLLNEDTSANITAIIDLSKEEKIKRDRILSDFIDGQINNYGWKKIR